ncbi:MAG: helix-turn-helix domain-containing protein [Actinomycetota bacterium]
MLYNAAAELFVERGYEDTTMADIAERAGTAASRRPLLLDVNPLCCCETWVYEPLEKLSR